MVSKSATYHKGPYKGEGTSLYFCWQETEASSRTALFLIVAGVLHKAGILSVSNPAATTYKEALFLSRKGVETIKGVLCAFYVLRLQSCLATESTYNSFPGLQLYSVGFWVGDVLGLVFSLDQSTLPSMDRVTRDSSLVSYKTFSIKKRKELCPVRLST